MITRIYILFLLIIPFIGKSQLENTDNSPPIDSVDVASGSSDENIFTIFSGNPGRATLYSLILPGAGQFYNKRYWKIPLVYAMEGTVMYYLIKNRKTFKDFDQCYRTLVIDGIDNPPAVCQNIDNTNDAFTIRNAARSNMELSWVVLIGAHLLQTLEAFIDRHLIDFDTDENLSIIPTSQYDSYTVNNEIINTIPIVSFTFTIGK